MITQSEVVLVHICNRGVIPFLRQRKNEQKNNPGVIGVNPLSRAGEEFTP